MKRTMRVAHLRNAFRIVMQAQNGSLLMSKLTQSKRSRALWQ